MAQTSQSRIKPSAPPQEFGEADALLDRASQVVGAFERHLTQALDATRSDQTKAITAIYRVYSAFGGNHNRFKAYCTIKGIKIDSRSRYLVQPLVRHLMGGRSRAKDLRNKVTIWSGAITFAERQAVKPDDLSRFLRSKDVGGIDAAYRLLRKEDRGKLARAERAQKLAAARTAYEQAHPPTRIPDTAFTKEKEPGLYLLAVEVTERHTVEIRAILERPATQVEQTFDDHILAWAALRTSDA